ncbi:hypothetical protein [Robertmurraya sp. Marseille-Q9965]
MKIFISIILSSVLLVAMSACQSSSEEAAKPEQSQSETSSKTDNSSKSDESSTSKTNTSKNTNNGSDTDNSSGSSTQASSAKTNSSDKKNESEEIYYGQWQINKVIAYGPVGTYSSDDVKKLIGKQLAFSKKSATRFGDKMEDLDETVTDPVYKKSVITKNDFPTNYKVTFEQLGINGDSVTEVVATSTEGIGTVFFLTPDNNKLILFGGGTFFELAKLTPEEINENEAVSLVEDYLNGKNELIQDENHFVLFEEKYNDYYIVRYSTLVSGHSSTNGRYAVDINNGEIIELTASTDLDSLND